MIANLTVHERSAGRGACARRPGSFQSWTIRTLDAVRVDGFAPDAMKPDDHMVQFRSSPAGPSGGWHVEIRIDVNHLQYIYGFDSQFDADEWIERENEWMKLLRSKL